VNDDPVGTFCTLWFVLTGTRSWTIVPGGRFCNTHEVPSWCVAVGGAVIASFSVEGKASCSGTGVTFSVRV
jgi:hypothetical protein